MICELSSTVTFSDNGGCEAICAIQAPTLPISRCVGSASEVRTIRPGSRDDETEWGGQSRGNGVEGTESSTKPIYSLFRIYHEAGHWEPYRSHPAENDLADVLRSPEFVPAVSMRIEAEPR